MALLNALLLACLYHATPILGYGPDIGPGPSPARISIQQSTLELDQCPGYRITNVSKTSDSVTADLFLAGDACNTYGYDIEALKLQVNWESENRLHVQIFDAAKNVYQVPQGVLERPGGTFPSTDAKLDFSYTENPFSFVVTRKGDTGQALFNTSGSTLVFQSQFLQFRSSLVDNANLYGLGESTDPFRLNTTQYNRTLWDKDTPFVPPGRNLYGSHPVYFEHRGSQGTHGVFFLNSDGMDITIDKTAEKGQYIEYSTIGGIVDLYFMAGPTPINVAEQYAEIVGMPQLPPYWAFGFHNCKYGYRDLYEVAEVIANYSTAGIPLEAFWSDINYMDRRRIFTTDPLRYPKDLFRQVIDHLHQYEQKSIFMNNPAIGVGSPAYDAAVDQNVLMMYANGSGPFTNVVWPGAAVFPDWTHPNAQTYWTGQIEQFYNPDTGFDIDGIWIDMNEAALFCPYPCTNPYQFAIDNKVPPEDPPVRYSSPRPIPGFGPDFQPNDTAQAERRSEWLSLPTYNVPRGVAHGTSMQRRADGDMLGLEGRNLTFPAYKIRNDNGEVNNYSIDLDITHASGQKEYDMHNLYGRMMSQRTKSAMESRRPGKRTLIISRSTWAGTGKDVGHWLGDNASRWEHYRFSITGLLQFASIYQVPMVGSDICGFNDNASEQMCARWTTLGAFSPFYRTHADTSAAHQELYLWPSVTEAAKYSMDIRYRLLDYMYGQFHRQSTTGTPFILPMYFLYPEDANTFAIEHQYFYGDAILISPVLYQDSTSVDAYFPAGNWYEFLTYKKFTSTGQTITLNDIAYTEIPVHIRGGTIIGSRLRGQNTTTATRRQDFRIIVAPGADGKASGSLYLDDGESETQAAVSNIDFTFDGSTLKVTGSFGYNPGVQVAGVVFAGQTAQRTVNGRESTYNETTQVLDVKGPWSLLEGFEVQLSDASASPSATPTCEGTFGGC
ncbi:alpha-glucosidase [Pseudovirgaria hyperparasitica]|uniref:alpha-glucosidase n=1 Tax=Pseudovirgaria hyperparasitica TaxID=470096 RepID=A0A6A6VW26_9PEZI|nr:alpha-glucosidase [Pseudovirgaria hyperparasitica]KAF2753996.1 alpha-glucosidase [Pseudovirgaria hyperparasitica]